jgi:hypothetical protein
MCGTEFLVNHKTETVTDLTHKPEKVVVEKAPLLAGKKKQKSTKR